MKKIIRKAYCNFCGCNVHLFRMKGWRFVPHGDSLGVCPNAGYKVENKNIILK